MNKYPFSEEGVEALITSLYLLSVQGLQEEAEKVLNDFKAWFSGWFDLTESQLSYLDKIDTGFILEASSVTYHALLNRQPISLIKPQAKTDAAADGTGKIIDLGKTSSISYSDETGVVETESLTYIISYQ